jgi:hypothetical protein
MADLERADLEKEVEPFPEVVDIAAAARAVEDGAPASEHRLAELDHLGR